MKLKQDYNIVEVSGMLMAVTPDSNMAIVLSESASYIFGLLTNETTEEALLDNLCEHYEAPRKVLSRDLKKLLNKCRKAGLIEE